MGGATVRSRVGPRVRGRGSGSVLSEIDVTWAPDSEFTIWYGAEIGHGTVSGPVFAAELDPTPTELRKWAYAGALTPSQDWDFCILDYDHLGATYVELARDSSNPSQDFFLHLLYGRVGRTLSPEGVSEESAVLANELATDDDVAVRRFAQRVQALIADPTIFDSEDWIYGRLVQDPTPWP